MNQNCCTQPAFERLNQELSPMADPGSAEGIEFTLGTCQNCKQSVMHCWAAGGLSESYVVVGKDFVERLRATPDRQQRKELLAQWWNAL
jgi:hypothetical protein